MGFGVIGLNSSDGVLGSEQDVVCYSAIHKEDGSDTRGDRAQGAGDGAGRRRCGGMGAAKVGVRSGRGTGSNPDGSEQARAVELQPAMG